MNYEKIGSFIAQKRKEKGLTQKELALKIGLTDKAISKWERGLGCPDVSILEVLANELGVSILEILKGRIIEEEVIKVTEMNDYVKETVNYTNIKNKDNLKSLFSKIVIILIVIIDGFLIILNVGNLAYLSRKYEFDFDSSIILKMQEKVSRIEDNINIIKNNQGIFHDGDYRNISDLLDEDLPLYKNIPILRYTGIKRFSLNDIYILNLSLPKKINFIKILNLLKKYDANMDNYLQIYYDASSLIFALGEDSFLDYRYQLTCLFNYPFDNNNNFLKMKKIMKKVWHYNYLIDSYYYLTELIKEVGEINA